MPMQKPPLPAYPPPHQVPHHPVSAVHGQLHGPMTGMNIPWYYSAPAYPPPDPYDPYPVLPHAHQVPPDWHDPGPMVPMHTPVPLVPMRAPVPNIIETQHDDDALHEDVANLDISGRVMTAPATRVTPQPRKKSYPNQQLTKMVSSLTLGPQDLTNPYSLVIFCRCHQWRPHLYVYSQDKHTLA